MQESMSLKYEPSSEPLHVPLSSEYGKHETVKTRFCPWRQGKCPEDVSIWQVVANSNPAENFDRTYPGVSIFARFRWDPELPPPLEAIDAMQVESLPLAFLILYIDT